MKKSVVAKTSMCDPTNSFPLVPFSRSDLEEAHCLITLPSSLLTQIGVVAIHSTKGAPSPAAQPATGRRRFLLTRCLSDYFHELRLSGADGKTGAGGGSSHSSTRFSVDKIPAGRDREGYAY